MELMYQKGQNDLEFEVEGVFIALQDYIGRCILTLTRVILEGEFQDTFVLQGAKSGKLNLHFKWTPQPIYRDRDRDQ